MYSSRYNTRPRRCRVELCRVRYSPVLYYLRTVLHWILYIKTTQRRDQIKFILQKAHLISTWDRLVHNFQRNENKIKSLSECAELQMPINIQLIFPPRKIEQSKAPVAMGSTCAGVGRDRWASSWYKPRSLQQPVKRKGKTFFFAMSDTLCWFHLHTIVISFINWSRCFLFKRDSSTVNGYHALRAYSESDYLVVFF